MNNLSGFLVFLGISLCVMILAWELNSLKKCYKQIMELIKKIIARLNELGEKLDKEKWEKQ